jgi:hypothetical protein
MFRFEFDDVREMISSAIFTDVRRSGVSPPLRPAHILAIFSNSTDVALHKENRLYSWTSQAPGESIPSDFGYDNVLLGQGCRAPHGATVE